MPDTLIVVPTFNEAGNLARLVGDLRRNVPDARVLVIDDDSPDGTGRIADELAKADDHVSVEHRARKSGLGSAHVLGMERALSTGAEVLVTMDCDYTHKPEDVPTLLARLAVGDVDLVIGSRWQHPEGISDWPLSRRLITRTAHFMTTHLLGIRFDATNAFRAYRTQALRSVPFKDVRAEGYSFMFEMVFACLAAGLRIVEVPVQLPIRQAGESKISKAEIAKAVLSLGRLSLARAAGAVRGKARQPAR